MLNHIVISGRLTRNPEVRYTKSGIPVAAFSLAVERDYNNKGEAKQTDFVECVAWRNSANFAEKYFTKGRMAIVEGRLQSRKWEDKEGNKRTSWEVMVENMYFADSKPKDEPNISAGFTNLDDDESDLPWNTDDDELPL